MAHTERVRGLVSMLAAALCAMIAGLSLWSAPALATEHCENEASRQGPSGNLPECRVYEQVTPVDKGDATDIFDSTFEENEGGLKVSAGQQAYVAEDGEAILVHTDGSFAPEAPPQEVSYVFSRSEEPGKEGWHMTPLAQPIDQPQEVKEGGLFDPGDLSAVGFKDWVGTLSDLLGGDESAFQYTELDGRTGGPYAPLFSLSGFATFDEEKQATMVGASEDLSRIVLQSENHSLAPGAEAQDQGSYALYETAAGGGECSAGTSNCKLIDVNEQGEAMPCGATLGHGQVTVVGSGDPTAVSSDGSKIFFTTPEPEPENIGTIEGPGCWNSAKTPQENPPELYMREDGTRTVEISVPEAGVQVGTPQNPQLPAVFVGASSDGSKVFFMTKMQLTKGAVGQAPEVYEYNTEPGPREKTLTLISGGPSGTLEGDVENVTAVSSDGSSVYFSAYGNLAGGASQYSSPTKEGENFAPINLYRYDTLTEVTTYIATLNKFDYPVISGEYIEDNWYENEFGGKGGKRGTEREGLAYGKEWYATGNGQFLVFDSVLPLTRFDNVNAPGVTCEDNYGSERGPARCSELYRYNADAAEKHEPSLVCVSCAGGAPIDGAYFNRVEYHSPMAGPNRPISENGEDVFFESANALVPNATPGRDHVYEWHDGTISLISSPSDPGNALFLGSSASGRDVFFVTHAQLVPADTDQAADIYDARVDGGFAGVTPSRCTGTGCQGVPGAPPIFATPAGVTFEGVGNFSASQLPAAVKPKSKKPAKCKRAFVKKHNRCIKQKKKTRKKAKKSTEPSRGGKK